jgi:cold shock CspA family protein
MAMGKYGKHTGRIKSWNIPRGFGFIEQKGAEPDMFVHFSNLAEGTYSPLSVGLVVRYDILLMTDGRTKAVNVAVVG